MTASPTTRRLAGRRLAAAVVALGTCAGLAGCGGSASSPEGTAVTAAKPHSRVSGNPATWPLTGLPVASGQSAVQRRPPLVVKMDNTADSAPQIGLGEADMVVEELVEGGITRLAAFYYSQLPARVGPVRSMRASDIGIVSPVGGSMVTSGAAPVTIARLHHAGVHFFAESATGFARDSSRYAPYNLFASLPTIAREAHQRAGRPADYLPFGSGAFPAGKPADSVAATFSGGHTTDWSYVGSGASGHYVNTNSNAASDDRFAADNVLVLRVQVGLAGYRDPAGNPVPETHFTGDGDAVLFHGGQAVKATWHKDSLGAPLQLSAGGQPLAVPPGHTWIELVPAHGGALTYHR